MTSVGEKLLDEIERVSAKRERWKQYAKDAGFPNVSFAPGMALMDYAIKAGKEAVMSADPLSAIEALKLLEGFDSDD